MINFFAAIGGAGVFFLTAILSVILNGWAFKVVWNWFMPHFFGLPSLTLLSAVVICFIATYLTYQQEDFTKVERGPVETLIRAVTITVSKPLFALLFGWVLTLFL